MEAVETPLEAEDDGLAHLRIEIRRVLTGRRLDKYLSGRLGKSVSRTALQRYIHEGNVTVNGRIVKPSYTIRAGDVIEMAIEPQRPHEIPPEPIPLEVVYEDEDLIAINKQADLIIHPARGNWTGTLVNALAHYFRKNWRDIAELPTSGQAFRPGIVHRLDRDTTGILLVAKSELALWRLGRQFELRKVHKTYSAIVHGAVALDEDVIDAPIGKHPRIRERYAVHRLTGKPYSVTTKQALTRYKVVEKFQHVGKSKAAPRPPELHQASHRGRSDLRRRADLPQPASRPIRCSRGSGDHASGAACPCDRVSPPAHRPAHAPASALAGGFRPGREGLAGTLGLSIMFQAGD